jgi:hypothetical protein
VSSFYLDYQEEVPKGYICCYIIKINAYKYPDYYFVIYKEANFGNDKILILDARKYLEEMY